MATNWHINYSEEARQDLLHLKDYLTRQSQARVTTNSQLIKILDAVDSLSTFPNRHQRWPDDPWFSYGIRFMPIAGFIIFYFPDHVSNTVLIVRIMTSKADFKQALPLQ